MADAAPKIPIEEQIAEVQRELVLRQAVYPGQIDKKNLTEGAARRQMDRLNAVLHTLLFCQTHEFQIRDYIASLGQKVAE